MWLKLNNLLEMEDRSGDWDACRGFKTPSIRVGSGSMSNIRDQVDMVARINGANDLLSCMQLPDGPF